MASSRVFRIVFLWMAVSAGIFALSGCGKSNSKKTTESKPAATQTAGKRVDQPELDQVSGQTAIDNAEIRVESDEPSTRESDNNRVAGNKNPVRILIYDNEITNSNPVDVQPTRDGSSDANLSELVYTGSAPDSMVRELQARLASVDATSQQRNLDFARRIGLVQVHYNGRNPGVVVTALIERDGTRKYYDLAGYMQNDFTAQVGNSNAAPYVSADVKCMDLNGGCNNIRVRFTDHKTSAVAYVIVRQTNADLILPAILPYNTNNIEFKRFKNILYNTIHNSCRINSVCGLTMNTSETVNGTSTFLIGMKMLVGGWKPGYFQQQLVVFTGPLVSTANGGRFAVAASQGGGVRTVGESSPVLSAEYPYMSDLIKSVALVENNGNGKLRLALTIRANDPNVREASFEISVQREQRPVRLRGL